MKYLVTYESYGDYKKDRYCKTEKVECTSLEAWWLEKKSQVGRGGGILILWSLELDD